MIDMHSHIIYGIDDGPSNINQAMEMIKAAERLGIGQIVATPHFHQSIYNLECLEENFKELVHKAADYNVKLILGCEVFINPDGNSMMKNKRKLSVDKSEVVLIEFPFNSEPQQCLEAICKLRLQNIVPVLAHIERNRVFLNKLDYIVMMIKAGCYIQMDVASVLGVYGFKIKEFCRKLLQMKIVDFVASNAHCSVDYLNWYLEAYRRVAGWVGNEDAGLLFHDNAKLLLEHRCADDQEYKNILRWERLV